MTTTTIIVLAVLILAAATLYSSVGHGGASAYLAAMALLSVEPAVMKPTALCLNVLVASIATYKFARAGCFSWDLFWPFTVTSVPAAFLGGATVLPAVYYKPLVAVVLLFAAYRLLIVGNWAGTATVRTPALAYALITGGAIGLLAGLTGTGGGIFLSPLLLFMGWAQTRQASGVAAPFIVVNSVAGIAGLLTSLQHVPPAIPLWGACAIAGGLLGAHYGSGRLVDVTLRRLLGLVLVVAALKLGFT